MIIRSFASGKGMRLNPKKCTGVRVINFLQYLPASDRHVTHRWLPGKESGNL